MPWRAIKCFAKAFEPSMRAARREGPKTGMPTLRKWAWMPSTRGCSGPGTTRSTALARAKRARAGWSASGTLAVLGVDAVPGFPGATKIRATLGEAARRQARACSLPPAPRRRMVSMSVGK